MRFFIFLFLIIFLRAEDLNMVVGKPIIASVDSDLVEYAIYRGYSSQISDLRFRIEENDIDMRVKYLGDKLKPFNNQIAFYLKADKKAEKELEAFIKRTYDRLSKNTTDKKLSFTSVKKKRFSFKISKVKKVSLKDIDDDFKSVIFQIKSFYHEDEFRLPFYRIKYQGAVKYAIKADMLKPHIFFYEYFFPKRIARRYFLEIYIYVIGIDKDGGYSLEYRKVKDFNWRRSYRYIKAQTGQIIRELIKNKTGVDIR